MSFGRKVLIATVLGVSFLGAMPAQAFETDVVVLPKSIYRSSLELHVSVPMVDEEIAGGIEYDTAYTGELVWRPPHPFPPRDLINLHIGIGLAGTYQDGELDDGTRVLEYTAGTLRYHLGADFDFTQNLRVVVAPFIGLGLSRLDITQQEEVLPVDEVDLVWEAGLRVGGEVTFGNFTIGAGGIARVLNSKHDFIVGSGLVEATVEQDTIEAYGMIGWTF